MCAREREKSREQEEAEPLRHVEGRRRRWGGWRWMFIDSRPTAEGKTRHGGAERPGALPGNRLMYIS